METSTAPEEKLITTKELFSQENIRKKFIDLLGKRAQGFMTSVLQVVASNELLKNAEPNSVYNAAAVAATLNLPLNNSLGFAYIVPYNTRIGDRHTVVAQFQIGYKGYIQLAQRTGQYKGIAATKILKGQLIDENPLTGYKFDFTKKVGESQPEIVIGYASYFELINGFQKIVYMSVEELQAHGLRFSKSYGHSNGLWKKDFNSMALKTVLKLNLSKFGPMSIDLERALVVDSAVINDADTLDVKYLDNGDAAEEPITVESLQLLLDEKVEFLVKAEFDDANRIIGNNETASFKKLHALLTSKVA